MTYKNSYVRAKHCPALYQVMRELIIYYKKAQHILGRTLSTLSGTTAASRVKSPRFVLNRRFHYLLEMMMSAKQPWVIDHVDWPKLLSNPPLLTSFQSGWSSIHLAHYRQPLIDVPEMSTSQHRIIIPLGHGPIGLEYVLEGRMHEVFYQEKDYTSGNILILPADLPHKSRANSAVKRVEWIHCYLEPSFLAQIAYESVNPAKVELLPTLKKVDLLIYQIGFALKTSLELDGVGSRFYADSMATALSAHLLRHYSSHPHRFCSYEDGLSKQQLRQVSDYIQGHLGENLSLYELANELRMSQYYFCHLFKRSTGISPHQYLIRQRVERAKHLLKQPDLTITFIAMECGFASPSHLARCFRKCTGMTPKQFRRL